MSDLKTQRTAALKAGDREKASALKKEILDVLYGKASDGTVSSTEEVSYCRMVAFSGSVNILALACAGQ